MIYLYSYWWILPKNAIVSKMTYNTLHNQMWCILFPISKLSKTHAHTMDNLSKVLCMCQNPFDTRKFTSLVPNCYFFVSLPGQTCCFRGVNIFYVKLTKQFTKKFEFTIIHFPCPVKCTNHLPQDPSIIYMMLCQSLNWARRSVASKWQRLFARSRLWPFSASQRLRPNCSHILEVTRLETEEGSSWNAHHPQ